MDISTGVAAAPIKLIIAGGREFDNYKLLLKYITAFQQTHYLTPDLLTIVSGGARGADKLGERYAREYGIEFERYIPDWEPNGVFDRTAGFRRNKLMAQNATHLLAFWDGESRGTKNMIDTAKRLGLSVDVVYYMRG